MMLLPAKTWNRIQDAARDAASILDSVELDSRRDRAPREAADVIGAAARALRSAVAEAWESQR